LNYKWIILSKNEEREERLCKDLNISPILARVLINRGLVETEKAIQYLNPSLKEIHDPFMMKDMKKATERLLKAIHRGERILIYGDYDVDGLTSTAILSSFLRKMGVKVFTKIPDRLEDGYGLKEKYIHKAKDLGISLIVTVDCGISDNRTIDEANKLGIDCIITDHHEVSGPLPKALAVIDPKRRDCEFPFRDLAGVGVAFNLMIALRRDIRSTGVWEGEVEPNLREYLDLVALGTISDIAPIRDENRILVHYGLKELRKASRPGLRALINVSGINPRAIDVRTISFVISPRLNAAGRMGSPDRALNLLLSEDEGRANLIARELDEENRKRQAIEELIFQEAISMIDSLSDKELKAIVLGSERWHQGVIGIVASRLVERFYRPAILISIQNGKGKGSGRSIDSFDLMNGLIMCSSLLESYGGHSHAAGLEICEEKIEYFKNLFLDLAEKNLRDKDLYPSIFIDSPLDLSRIETKLVEDLSSLSPFGPSNPEPVFLADKVTICERWDIGKNNIKLRIKEGQRYFDGIGFGIADRFPSISPKEMALVYTPFLEDWQGLKLLKIKVVDMKERDKIEREGNCLI
jgi:single-stranded-DNA-specific exonuclease